LHEYKNAKFLRFYIRATTPYKTTIFHFNLARLYPLTPRNTRVNG
jgi:hypothetical protein